MTDITMRLDKYLAQRGIASRRGSADLVRAGCVSVDGTVINEPGFKVVPDQHTVALGGKPLPRGREPKRTIMLHKPPGYICTTSARQGRTVYELLPQVGERLVPVGRLDKDSEGVLLLSNDGELINRLTHPSHGHDKIYRVTVRGTVTEEQLETLASPMEMDSYTIRPVKVRVTARRRSPEQTELEFILSEGRNRQIRNMCAAVWLRIIRLQRTHFCGLTLGTLAAAQWRDLTPAELASLDSD